MFRRTPRIPTELRQALSKQSKDTGLAWMEGVIAAEELEDSGGAAGTPAENPSGEQGNPAETQGVKVWLVAGRTELILVPQDVSEPLTATPWWQVDRAGWDPESDVLYVSFATSLERLRVRALGKTPVRFLTVLRERVENSVVISETVPLGTGDNVRVAVRRTPDRGLVVQAIGDAGIDVSHPDVAKRVRPVMEKLAEVSGAA
ncbi:hypothetical protein [Timonella senegalensis]|uniref:hypothetical protein n=1 Tax=Timonella senegalensis TaxID=1465825 RepID=UPI002FDE3802